MDTLAQKTLEVVDDDTATTDSLQQGTDMQIAPAIRSMRGKVLAVTGPLQLVRPDMRTMRFRQGV